MSLKSLAVVISALAITGAAHAIPITGGINFSGGMEMDGPMATATQVTKWVNPVVGTVSGDLDTYVNTGDAATMAEPWVFNNPTSGLWNVGGFTFDLTSSAVKFQNSGFLAVGGVGVISGNNFTPTKGTWYFTTQGSPVGGVFTFSAFGEAVPQLPDAGSTVALLGFGLLGLSAYGRKSLK